MNNRKTFMNSSKTKLVAAVVCLIALFVFLRWRASYKSEGLMSEVNSESKYDPVAYKEQLRRLRPQQIDEWATQLKLSPEQKRSLEQIFTECDDQLVHAFEEKDKEKVMRKADGLMACYTDRIQMILRENQKPAYTRMIKEKQRKADQFYAARHKAWHKKQEENLLK